MNPFLVGSLFAFYSSARVGSWQNIAKQVDRYVRSFVVVENGHIHAILFVVLQEYIIAYASA